MLHSLIFDYGWWGQLALAVMLLFIAVILLILKRLSLELIRVVSLRLSRKVKAWIDKALKRIGGRSID